MKGLINHHVGHSRGLHGLDREDLEALLEFHKVSFQHRTPLRILTYKQGKDKAINCGAIGLKHERDDSEATIDFAESEKAKKKCEGIPVKGGEIIEVD